jgi:hypothetical protein
LNNPIFPKIILINLLCQEYYSKRWIDCGTSHQEEKSLEIIFGANLGKSGRDIDFF